MQVIALVLIIVAFQDQGYPPVLRPGDTETGLIEEEHQRGDTENQDKTDDVTRARKRLRLVKEQEGEESQAVAKASIMQVEL